MENRPDDLPPEDSNIDEDLEILDRILKEEQSQWDENLDSIGGGSEGADDDFYIFEDEDEVAAPAAEEAPQRISGRFLLLAELFSDERGMLYTARDGENEERLCRLRLLSKAWLGAAPVETLLARTEQARSASSAIEHPSILAFESAGLSQDGSFWLSSGEPEGESLAQLMRRSGALPPAHALEITQQLLLALEHAAAHGLRHGALNAHSISLALKIGWSEENPFGVGVRISEIGLSSLAPKGNENSADLLACASLLAQLLSGEELDPWASSSNEALAAISDCELSEPLLTLLETGLADDEGDRYQSPKDFRLALERVPEFRPKARGGKRSLVSNMLLLTVLAAVLYGTKTSWWPASASEANAKQPEPIEQIDKAELEALRLEKAELLAAEQLRTQQAQEELEAALLEKAKLEQQAGQERAQLEAGLEAERSAAEAARRAERMKSGQVDALTANLESSQARILELESAAEKRVRLAKESGAAEALASVAADIERMLRAMSESNLINARQVAAELANNELIQLAPISLLPFFESLLEAYDAMAGMDARTDPFVRSELLEPTSALLLQAVAQGRPAMTGDNASALLDDPARIALYQSHLDSLSARLQSQRSGLRSEFKTLWAGTLANPDQPPPLVMRRAAAAMDRQKGVREFIQRYARFFEEQTLNYDVLELDKLKAIESLDAWNEQLAVEPLSGLENEIEFLSTLGYAKRFYAGENRDTLPAHLENPGPGKAWLERLSLSASLLDSEVGLRGKVGTRLLYHSITDAGEEGWRWDTLQADPHPPRDAEGSRLVLQEFHDADGVKRGERTLRFYRVGLRLFESGAPPTELLDLAIDGPPYAIYPWHAAKEALPPAKLLVSPGAFEAFRKRLKEEPWRGFIVEEGRQTTTWTRELGLVRHSIPGRITYELVYAELP